jgi:arsenate reductase-like glutaredoxin family protein
MAASGGPSVQLFGRRDSRESQRARRFFSERRVPVTFVDLSARPMAPTELRRFVERLGPRALADTDGRLWQDLGLGYLRMDDDELADRLLADQRLLRLPLCRYGNAFSAGADEPAWRSWMARP